MRKLRIAKNVGDRIHCHRFDAHSLQLFGQFACVLLGVGLMVTSVIVSIHQREISTIERSGKTGIALLSPKDDRSLSAPPVFRWQGRSAQDHYVLELFDDSLLPIWASGEIRDLQIRLPSEVYATLLPGRRYFWMVTAFSPRAKTEESKLGRFIIHR